MINFLDEYIRKRSINNLRFGEIISKDGGNCTVRIGTREVAMIFTTGNVGDIVSIYCPDGDVSKEYIGSVVPVVLGEGETIEI